MGSARASPLGRARRTGLRCLLFCGTGVTGQVLVSQQEAGRAVGSADCWVSGWSPEICCSAPGARGNPLCWEHVYSYDRCCTDTEEGIQFDLQRRNFVSAMVRRGATVHFDIHHVSGGRTGATSAKTLENRATVLLVPASQVYSLKSVPPSFAEVANRLQCDPHAALALGLAQERANPASALQDWIRLLPSTFANVLWFTEAQLELVGHTFFSYVVQNWFEDLECMRRCLQDLPASTLKEKSVEFEDLRWALSVVKTRGFAFEATRESTMLVPLADFLNHNIRANVRTATLSEDALRFVATRTILPGEELCVDYAQASNLEFLIRYGFRVEDNPYGGRQFDLGGEPMQGHCPSSILRYDVPEIIENVTIDCHRQARYLSFEQQFGPLSAQEQLREDRYIYQAVEDACTQLLEMLQTPFLLSQYEADASDSIISIIVKEIRAERMLLTRCSQEFQLRQQETSLRPLPLQLAPELQAQRRTQDEDLGPSLAGDDGINVRSVPSPAFGNNDEASSQASGAFAASIDRSRVDQLLQKLQQGIAL